MKSRIVLVAGVMGLAVWTVDSRAASGTWNVNGGGNWSDTTKWKNGIVADGASNTANFSTINITAGRTVTVNSSRTIGFMIWADASTASHDWTLNRTSSNVLTLNAGTAVPTISVNNRQLTISAVLASTSGFTKLGGGTLALSANNTISGTVGVNAGTLRLTSELGLGAVPASFTADAIVLNGGRLMNNNANLTISANRGIELGAAGGGFQVGWAGTTWTKTTAVASVISGPGALTMYDDTTPGVLKLSGANTYSGATTIGQGVRSNLLLLGASEVIPNGAGKGGLAISANSIMQMAGFSETVNGFSGMGTVSNSTGNSTLTVGEDNAGGSPGTWFGGLFATEPGATLTLTKTGNGVIDMKDAVFGHTGTNRASGGFLGTPGSVNQYSIAETGGGYAPGSAGFVRETYFNDTLKADGGAFHFDLTSTTTAGSGANDLVFANNLDLNGASTLVINPLQSLSNSPYTLFTYNTLLAGGAANFTVPAVGRYTFTASDGAGSILLTPSGSSASLVWSGAAGDTWDQGVTTNWLNGANPDVFFNADSVTFDDSASQTDIALAGTLMPELITVNSASNYTFAGSGYLSGISDIVKDGSGMLTISTTNDFTGTVVVSNGFLQPGMSMATTSVVGPFGSTQGVTRVLDGATYEVAGRVAGFENFAVRGAGVGGTGVVINTAGTQMNAFRRITLEGDSTFGAYGRFDIRGSVADTYLSTGGNDYDLTVQGAGGFYLVSVAVDPALGDITVLPSSGFGYEGGTLSLGNPNKTLSIGSNSYLQIYNATVPLNKQIVLADKATLRSTAGGSDINASSNNVIWGDVQLDGTATANMNGGSVRILGNVSGAGGWQKTGGNDLWLNGTNTYTGQTLIQAGRVIMVSTGGVNGMITGSSDIRIENGSLLLLNDRDGAAFDDHLGDSVPITLAGGGITMRGNNNYGNINEYAGALTLDGTRTSFIEMWNGTNTATDGTALLFASYTPGDTGWLNIYKGTGAGTIGAGPTNSPDPHVFFGGQAEGILPNTLVNGTNFARYSSANGVYAAATTAFNGAADQSGTDVNFYGARGAESDSLDADRSVWSITAANPDATRAAVDLAGFNLYVDQIMVNGTTNFSINNTGLGGSLQTTNFSSLQVVANTGTLTINAPITGSGGIRKAGNSNLILTGNNSYTGATSLDSGNGAIVIRSDTALGSTAAGTVINGQNGTTGVSLLMDPGATGSITVNEPLTLAPSSSGRAMLKNTSGTNTWAGAVTLTGSGNLAGFSADGGFMTVSGDVSGDLSGQQFVIRGGGRGAFVGNLNFAGTFFKTDDGGWQVGADGKTLNYSLLSLNRGLVLLGTSNILCATAPVVMGEGSVNTAVLNLNGFDQTIEGLYVNSGVTGSATVTTTNGPATLTIWTTNSYNFNKTITDAGVGSELTLVKDGSGTQRLSGANTFHGSTIVRGGVLEVGNTTALQNSTVSNTLAGGVQFSGITSATFGALAGSGDIALTNVAGGNVALTVGGNGDSTTYGGVLDGAGSLTKVGNGLLILTNAQTYAGTTIVRGGNSGGLRLTENATPGTGAITVDGNTGNGAALELEGDHTLTNAFTLSARQQGTANSAHVRNLSGTNLLSGTVNLTTGGSTYNYESVSGLLEISGQLNGQASGTRTLQLMGAGDGILSGVYNGNANPAAALNKMGAGTWTLTATNDYKGTTRILEGTLALSGSGSIATSTNIDVSLGAVLDVTAVSGGFALASNQTLTGLGTVNGGLSLSEGATLSPGASPGLITVSGDLDAQGGSTMLFELASTSSYDRVVGIDNLTLAGTINVTLLDGFNPVAGDVFDLLDWTGALTDGGYALNTPALTGSLTWDTTDFETDGTLAVIPEPATVGLVGLMGLALLLRRRTRNG